MAGSHGERRQLDRLDRTVLHPARATGLSFIPPDGDLAFYKEFCSGLPQQDQALAFGQHANADISSQREDTFALIETIVSLQPKGAGGEGASVEEKTLAMARDLKPQVHVVWSMREVKSTMAARGDPDPMKTVLFQGLSRIGTPRLRSRGVRRR